MNFKFTKDNNIFKWESNFMCLEFSEPEIQAFNEFADIDKERKQNNIMYYSYKVSIFKKYIDYDENDNEFVNKQLVSERYADDFNTIEQLQRILDFQLKDNTVKNGQRIEYQSGKIEYRKTLQSEGFACDDMYEITKIVDENNNNDKYIVYVGNTYDFQGVSNSCGIRTSYVCSEDIKELLKCVNEFIDYSIEDNNNLNKKYRHRFL